ncbi:MAG TPA: hypothetical protein VL175_06075 [Pirellulales bacterium]|nr:hypothetical protein [Pirellulales bacterium]
MLTTQSGQSAPIDFEELLGYLNFSCGTADPRFLCNLNRLFAQIEADPANRGRPLEAAAQALQAELHKLAGRSAAFRDCEQASAVLRLATQEMPLRYRAFHRDQILHQSDAAIWRPFFLGRVCEALLAEGGPWNEDERIIAGAIARLNDYIGHRPIAVLSSQQRMEPYAHEWIRPVPLFVQNAGVSVGRYQALIQRALDILAHTDPKLLEEAYFDLSLLEELALDPRAYDFDHPVNKRPNYHFGQWDPHHIDNQGHYRRFVLQQVTLDVLVERIDEPGERDPDELLLEGAAVLAGTMLMASGTSGNGPDTHDSGTSLATLLPRIANYRDRFYEQFIAGVAAGHGERLRAEATANKQPLAGARQHLNQQLARTRASQLEHVHLAQLFARMGYAQAALREAQVVPVAAARMTCEIQCRLTTGHLARQSGQLDRASQMLVEIEDFLTRAIQCGALVDPWNALGFQGQFSLFPAPENSVPDHRLDQLIELVDQILGLYARLWSDAAARDELALADDLATRMERLAAWWDEFAMSSVDSIEAFSGAEAYDSARDVAQALRAFYKAGAGAGDIAFWRKHVAHFNAPKAHALVVDALWQKPDLIAALALLMQWLSQAGSIPLRQGEYSFHALVQRWLAEVCQRTRADLLPAVRPHERQALVRRLFELLEANSEDYWQVPTLDLLGTGAATHVEQLEDDDEAELAEDSDDADEEHGIYSAAYDDVVYIDSTGDGVEADMLESGPSAATDFELEHEARRLGERLAFLRTVASLWKKAVLGCGPQSASPLPDEALLHWLEQATANEAQLATLLKAADERRIPAPSADRDSLLEFDRRRSVKESLLDKIIGTTIDTSDAARAMRAALPEPLAGPREQAIVDDVLRAVVRGDKQQVQTLWPELIDCLASEQLLYVPLAKGGDPARMTRARVLQQAVRDLLEWLPRLGLFRETCQLVETARLMEANNPVGPGAISEYDRLFATGYEALVEALVALSRDWAQEAGDEQEIDNWLIESLEQLTESLLKQWLAHSRTLRLSVLERIGDDKSWQALVAFVERYGQDLFTQRFMNFGNLRAILHQGVDVWLARLEEQADSREEVGGKLLDELGDKISRAEAVKQMSLVIEAVAENYAEYRDYNSTTTQSDRGDLLYTLLDFLRLRVQYDRVAWHLKPVMIAHAVLVRRGCAGAAEMWRRALAERTGELAQTLVNRCQELRRKYSMRLPTVSDRIGERFTRPLAIDRLRALVRPAMEAVRGCGDAASDSAAFEQLEQEAAELTQEPTGIGLEAPAWLLSLEQEVELRLHAVRDCAAAEESRLPLAQSPLSRAEIDRQLSGWELNP